MNLSLMKTIMGKESGLPTNFDKRADKYNKIAWVKDKKLLSSIKGMLELAGDERILEVGIGTGVLAEYLVHDCCMYMGVDSSKEMLSHVPKHGKIHCDAGSATQLEYADNSFDRVIFRNVLHHLPGKINMALREARRVLDRTGKIMFVCGITQSDEAISDFSRICCAKENRLVFTKEDVLNTMQLFFDVDEFSVIQLHKQSVMNWVDNCNVTRKVKKRIIKAHMESSDVYKKACNMTFSDDDIFVDMHFLIVTGIKKGTVLDART